MHVGLTLNDQAREEHADDHSQNMAIENETASAVYCRILEIGPIPPPSAGWGVRIGYVLEQLDARGFETAALDLGPNRFEDRSHCDSVRSAWDYARKVARYLWRGYRIHNHLNGESPKALVLVLYATILSRLFRRPPVLTWHGGLGYRFFPRGNHRLADWAYGIAMRLSGHIICNDETIKRHLIEYGVRPEIISPIPAFSPCYLDVDEVDMPEAISDFISGRDPYIFCYTLYRPEFHLPVLVEAVEIVAREYPQIGFLLVGDARGSDSIRQDIERRGLASHFHFAGDFSRTEFLTALGQADLCVRTHERDGVSSSVLEALSLGIPVVAADNPMRPPQVETYRATDPNDLADRILHVLRMPADRRRPDPPPILDTVDEEIAILTGRNAEPRK